MVMKRSCGGSSRLPFKVEVVLVVINGERRDIPERVMLHELIEHLALAPERVAVELNQQVVRRSDWSRTMLTEGDRVEIVHFVGGGAREVLNGMAHAVVRRRHVLRVTLLQCDLLLHDEGRRAPVTILIIGDKAL